MEEMGCDAVLMGYISTFNTCKQLVSPDRSTRLCSLSERSVVIEFYCFGSFVYIHFTAGFILEHGYAGKRDRAKGSAGVSKT